MKKALRGRSAEDLFEVVSLENLDPSEYVRVIGPDTKKVGSLTEPRQFDLLFKTFVGATSGEDNVAQEPVGHSARAHWLVPQGRRRRVRRRRGRRRGRRRVRRSVRRRARRRPGAQRGIDMQRGVLACIITVIACLVLVFAVTQLRRAACFGRV